MANLNIAWVLPTTRESGKTLLLQDIAHVLIELSADGGQTYIPVGQYAPGTDSTVVADIDLGTWFVRGTVVDTKGRTSVPTVASIVYEDNTPPGALTLNLSLA